MAQAGYTPIQLYYSTTASAAPSSGNLANGELAINITDGKLYYKDNGGTVRVLAGTGGTGVVAGSNTQVQFNNNGVFGASSGLTFDGTTLTANALTVSNAVTLSGGTANGVAYLNGSKVLTSGSALTFDGSSLGVAGRASLTGGSLSGAGNGMHLYFDIASNTGYIKGFHAGIDDRAIRLDGLNLQFAVAGSEQMRLTSTGLGIGTSSPAGKLSVNVDASTELITFRSSGGRQIWAHEPGANARPLTIKAQTLTYADDTATRLTVDTSGNLGLGVTPSAWVAGDTILQVKAGSSTTSLWGRANTGRLITNAYFDGSNYRYVATAAATIFENNVNGGYVWAIAPSGSAGAIPSFTNAMTLFSTGRLTVGSTTDYGDIIAGAVATSAGLGSNDGGISVRNIGESTQIRISRAGNSYNYLGVTGPCGLVYSYDKLSLAADTNQPITLHAGGAERARIDSSGNLLVGTTSNGAGLGTNSAIVGSYGPVFKSTGGSGFEAGDFWNASTTGDAYFVYWRTEAGGTVRGSVNYNRSLGLTSYNTTSDRRAKDILGPVTNSGETIDAIQVHIGQMHGATQSRPMFIADELQGPAPYCVTGEKDAVNEKGEPVYQQVDHSPLIPLLVAEIQSLRKRLAAAGIA